MRQAAAMLGISERKLFDLTKSGDVPHVRIGRRVLFRTNTLNEWLRAREQRGFGDQPYPPTTTSESPAHPPSNRGMLPLQSLGLDRPTAEEGP
ncbi:MAG: helix-turn-helix domain-containing protein [Phycisphaerales bacterium]|nr:helix-turn-helix domain-containing protein [Phycisphaerales bacterium]